MKVNCQKCFEELSSWEGVSCGDGSYVLCDACYANHIPNVYHSEDGIGETAEFEEC